MQCSSRLTIRAMTTSRWNWKSACLANLKHPTSIRSHQFSQIVQRATTPQIECTAKIKTVPNSTIIEKISKFSLHRCQEILIQFAITVDLRFPMAFMIHLTQLFRNSSSCRTIAIKCKCSIIKMEEFRVSLVVPPRPCRKAKASQALSGTIKGGTETINR